MRLPRIAPALAAAVVFAALAGMAGAVELPQNRPNPDRGALEQMLNSQRDLPPGPVSGFVHIPDTKAGVLIQPEGRTFRDVRTRWQPYITGGLIVVAVLAMAALFFIAGPMRYTKDPQAARSSATIGSSGSSTGWWRPPSCGCPSPG